VESAAPAVMKQCRASSTVLKSGANGLLAATVLEIVQGNQAAVLRRGHLSRCSQSSTTRLSAYRETALSHTKTLLRNEQQAASASSLVAPSPKRTTLSASTLLRLVLSMASLRQRLLCSKRLSKVAGALPYPGTPSKLVRSLSSGWHSHSLAET